jgi:uncharacterized protein YuzE
MKIQYNPEEDVLSILLSEHSIAESDVDETGVILDYDVDGNLVGLGVLDALRRLGTGQA